MKNKGNRLMALEGLRGLAAISVVVFHFLVLFYPALYYGTGFLQHSKIEDNLHGTPFNAFISGTFAVSVFFVLSGFVLTVGFFQTKKNTIIEKLAIKRYFRLMLPALASVILAWLYITFGLSHNIQAYVFTQSPSMNLLWETNTNFFHALYEGTIAIFTQGPIYNFNSVLWTMKYEFIGSFIIFIVALVFGRSKLRLFVYIALIIALYNTWFLGFIFGMLLADIYVNRPKILPNKKLLLYPLAIISVVLGGFPTGSITGTAYSFIALPWIRPDQNQSLYTSLGAFLLIICILNIPLLKKFMSSKPLVKIGSYTYSMYLVHQPIIYTLGTGMFTLFIQHFGYNKSVAMSILVTVPIVAIATIYFYKYVEVSSLQFAAYFEKIYTGKKDISFNVHLKRYINKVKIAMGR